MLSIRPYYDPMLNKLEFVNEVFYSSLLFLSFTFTTLIPDMDTKTYTGYIFILLIVFMIIVNAVVQIIDVGKKVSLRLKLAWKKC